MTEGRIAREVVVWMMSLLVALVCLRSGLTKMPGVGGEEFWARDFRRWGYPGWLRLAVGAAELVSFALLLVPRLAGYGAALFALVMLGAVYTHAAHGETGRLPFNLFLLVLSAVVFFARRPALTKKTNR